MSSKQTKKKPETHRSFGMIDQLKSGKWRARYLHPVTRQRIAVPGSPFETKTEAQKALTLIEADIEKQEWHDPKAGDVPFAEYVERWLTTSMGKHGRPKAETTRDLDRRNAERYLLRELHGPNGPVDLRPYKLKALTPALMNAWYAAVVAEATEATIKRFSLESEAARNKEIRRWARGNGHEVKATGRISPAVVAAWQAAGAVMPVSGRIPSEPGIEKARQMYRTLKAILNSAVAEGLLRTNPLNIKGAGKVHKRKDAPTATVDQVFALSCAMPEHYIVSVLVAAFGGLRFGEVFGLRRRDVDFAACTVKIVEPMKKVKSSKKPIFGTPKTVASARTVSMPPIIFGQLAAHMEQFTGKESDALVFTTRNERTGERNPVHAGSYGKIVRDRMEKVGMPPNMHLHDLRETSAFFAFEAGMNAQAVSERLGHADNRTTSEHYQRWSAERDRPAIARWNEQIIGTGFVLPFQRSGGNDMSTALQGGSSADTGAAPI